MDSQCNQTHITEDDQGEGYDTPMSAAELQDKLVRLQMKAEKYRRIRENKIVR